MSVPISDFVGFGGWGWPKRDACIRLFDIECWSLTKTNQRLRGGCDCYKTYVSACNKPSSTERARYRFYYCPNTQLVMPVPHFQHVQSMATVNDTIAQKNCTNKHTVHPSIISSSIQISNMNYKRRPTLFTRLCILYAYVPVFHAINCVRACKRLYFGLHLRFV